MDAPTNITITSIGPKKLMLQWDNVEDPSNPSNGQVRYYIITYYPTNNPELSQDLTTSNYLPNATLTSLSPATEYTITITAVSAVGEGNKSEPSEEINGITTNGLSQNLWDIPAAIFADPSTTLPVDLSAHIAATNFKNIILRYIEDNENLISNYIDIINNAAGNVILSFGALVAPIEEDTTKDVAAIIEFYEDKISAYGLNYINFEFKDDFFYSDGASNKHIAAITQILQNNPTLHIAYSFPLNSIKFGDPALFFTGLNDNDDPKSPMQFLQDLYDVGITPSLINAKTAATIFSPGITDDLLVNIQTSLEGSGSGSQYDLGLIAQLQAIYTNLSSNDIYGMTGICPTFGVNDNDKIFTVLNQAGLKDYAALKGIGNLNGIDVIIDQNLPSDIGNPFAFSNILKLYVTPPTLEPEEPPVMVAGEIN